MNDQDKIDLSSVNKKKKSVGLVDSFLKKAVSRQKGPLRDEEGKFAAQTGGGGLKAFKKLDWKRALPLVVVVALVGGFLVFQSFAATFNLVKHSSGNNYNCRIWAKENGAVFEFVGSKSNVHGPWLTNIYQSSFKVAPTTSEKLKWIDRAAELHNSYKIGSWDQKCRVRWEVYKEIQKTTPEGLEVRALDQQNKTSDVLQTIYADQIIPRGYTVNHYITEIIHTRAGLPIVPIKPFYSSINGWWGSDWPEKIKVCGILYNGGSNGQKSIETTVSMNVSAAGNQFKKNQVLEQLPNLNSGGWPKYEVCSSAISKISHNTSASKPKTAYAAHFDMVSIKDTTNPRSPYNRTYKWDTTPNDYRVYVEQYQIKKAE